MPSITQYFMDKIVVECRKRYVDDRDCFECKEYDKFYKCKWKDDKNRYPFELDYNANYYVGEDMPREGS